ncbi:uncharacterized protein LOC121926295 [Sceloporus undulatus]|uniref:uncharacterized protein LOC121926295 n=1 Tax=Sceloporus undulatus TaxID=8520 RepID=UPI001C4C6BF9|nr:uncharacterized protein LOC121926295 [Sceloporus undulatus]
MVALVAHWRTQLIHVHPYLDDLLIRAPSIQQAVRDTARVLKSLEDHGFLVNLDKSSIHPSQQILHLGSLIDTRSGTVCLTPERTSTIRKTALRALRSPRASLQLLSRLLGLMIAAIECLPWARFHARPLQWLLLPHQQAIALKSHRKIQILDQVRQSLRWWTSQAVSRGRPIWETERIQITTDASLRGWGAHCGSQLAQGRWSPEEQSHSINWLELRAIRLALQSFIAIVQHKPVLIRTDNITAKAHVNRQGGTRSRVLMKEAQLLLTWSETNLLSLRAEHLQGQLNSKADWLSRTDIDQGEWSLHPEVFQTIVEIFGPPIMDLFASPINAKTPRFISRFKTQGAEDFDALTCRWPEGLLYAFPPVALLTKLLSKVRRTGAMVILIAPAWPRRPWFSELLNLSTQNFPLTTRPDLLSQGQVYHPDPTWLQLHAWKLRGTC